NPATPSTAQTTTTRLDVRRGVPTTVTDTNSRVTTLSYDALGRSWQVWLPNRVTSFDPTYEFQYRVTDGQPVAVTTRTLNPTGTARDSSITLYDGFLRTRQTQELGPNNGRLLTETRYDERGLVSRQFATYYATGAPQQSIFRPSDTQDIESQAWHTYDALGRETEVRQIAGLSDRAEVLGITSTSYHGDRTTVIPPVGGTATTTLFDAQGQKTELRQHRQRSATAAYDSTRYTYTRAGQLDTLTDAAGNRWTYDYDQLGRTIESTDPDAGRVTSAYNDRGELTTRTNARGTLAYGYDNLGRQTQLRENSSTGRLRAEWVYDTISRAEGQLARSIRYGDEGQAYVNEVQSYDALYRPILSRVVIPSSEGALAGSYQSPTIYNEAGLVMSMGLPLAGSLPARAVTYTYDERTLWLNKTANVAFGSNITYSPTGLPERYLLNQSDSGPTVSVTHGFEQGTQRLSTTRVSSENVNGVDRSEAYSYDEIGNVLSIADTSRSGTDVQCFQYDHLRRMTEAWSQSTNGCATTPSDSAVGGPAPYWHSYTFDLSGNRRTETLHEQDTSRTYDYPQPGTPRPNAVTSVTQEAPGVTSLEEYGYDEAGNTISRQIGGDTQELTWDAEGHLASVEEADSSATSYLYDADGNRLISRSSTETTLYLGNTEVTLETGSTAPRATRYVDLGGGNTAVQQDDGSVSYTIADHHGTGQLAIDAVTMELTQRRTLPFGDIRGPTPSSWPSSRGFVGGVSDETGLTHLGAREYDPGLGRFISPDPVLVTNDPQQLNAYQYGANNPVSVSDPTGTMLPECWSGQYNCKNDRKGALKDIDFGKNYGRETAAAGGTPSPTWVAQQNDLAQGCRNDPGCAGTPRQLSLRYENERSTGYLRAAEAAAAAAENRPWYETAWSITADLTGLTDAWNCVSQFDGMACAMTGVTVLTGGSGRGAALALRYGDDVLGAARHVQDAIGGLRRTPSCPTANSFTAGTQVLMADGTTKNIEDLEIGDEVLATDPETGETSARTVTAEILGSGEKHLVTLTIATDEGTSATITATDGHPFWVPELDDWIDADELTPGTWLQTSAGTHVQITAVQQRTTTTTVHNLTVAADHTYYVLAGATPVLVHNCGGGVTVYRGVPEGHPGFDAAVDGSAVPRGGTASAEAHHLGNTDSPYTSWSTSDAVARRAATRGESGVGVVLETRIPSGRPHIHVNDQPWVDPDLRGEFEVLIEGPMQGNPQPVWRQW
ncbi:polymorphic toxin-type HINT domain-containing protein, partial [Streptomyces hainanensis]